MPAIRLALATVLVVTASLVAPSVAHAFGSGDVALRFSDAHTARLGVSREWVGEDANAARAWFDSEWGDGDGLFTYPEYQRFMEAESRFSSFAGGVEMDGTPAQVGVAEVELSGALGFAQQPNPVAVHVNTTLRFPQLNTSMEEHLLSYKLPSNTSAALLLPPGFHALEVTGLESARVSPDGRLVEGTSTGQTAVVRYSAMGDASFGGTEPGAMPTGWVALAVTAAVALVLGVVISVVALRWRRTWRP